ncbi:LysR family transcriptional regulator [Maricurvus nonylphenolicus]|uniref:LysR family transcriptional regulator n=1 Tax=Maricurvus nonylphenolicus TaxID=1008307 RepID=UPI0036F273CD
MPESPSMISVKHLRHLNAIIQHGTIHGAAEALHITQPALTRSLHTLESSLDIQLFERAKTGMTPTAFCLQIAENCQRILLDIDDLQRAAGIYRNLEGGELHLAVGRAIKEVVVREALPDFIEQHPSIATNISEGMPDELIYRLKQREVDMLIAGLGSYRDIEGISTQPLKTVKLSLLVKTDHPLAAKKTIELPDLANYPLVAPTVLTPSNPLFETLMSLNTNNQPIPSVMCNDYTALKHIVLRSESWMIATEYHFTDEIAQGELHQLDIQLPALNIDMGVIELKGRPRSPAAQAFISILEDNLD